jgi:hypothetical protein
MKLRGHDTFHLRPGWLRKVITAVEADKAVFKQPPLDLGATFGVGVNMVKAMRYWGETSIIIKSKLNARNSNERVSATLSLSLSLSLSLLRCAN